METKNKIILLLAILGVGVSVYLTNIKTSNNIYSCGFGQCNVVQASKYSELFGIPVAVFGLVFYVLLITFLMARIKKLLLAWALFGLLFSSYLTVIELFVLKAICGWCVISFVIIILINLLISSEPSKDKG